MSWFYNKHLRAWFHPQGERSDNPENQMPPEPPPKAMSPEIAPLVGATGPAAPSDCGCNKRGNRAAR